MVSSKLCTLAISIPICSTNARSQSDLTYMHNIIWNLCYIIQGIIQIIMSNKKYIKYIWNSVDMVNKTETYFLCKQWIYTVQVFCQEERSPYIASQYMLFAQPWLQGKRCDLYEGEMPDFILDEVWGFLSFVENLTCKQPRCASDHESLPAPCLKHLSLYSIISSPSHLYEEGGAVVGNSENMSYLHFWFNYFKVSDRIKFLLHHLVKRGSKPITVDTFLSHSRATEH